MVSVVSEQMVSQKRSVMAAFQSIHDSLGEHFSNVFKTITQISVPSSQSCQNWNMTLIQRFTLHTPYSSLEKGGIEKHNDLIRRFLRKGKRTDSFRADDILAVGFEPMHSPLKDFGLSETRRSV